jgi:hypothetical protein
LHQCVSFDDSSIEKPQTEIIGRRRQVEWVFSVNRMAVFGNAVFECDLATKMPVESGIGQSSGLTNGGLGVDKSLAINKGDLKQLRCCARYFSDGISPDTRLISWGSIPLKLTIDVDL